MPGAILDVAHVVVADDDLTWRHFAAGFVLDTLKSQSLALSLVSSGAGAIAEVTRLVDDGMAPEKIAVVTDLHMGDAPDHSGAHVVAYLPSGVRVAVLSGTVSERDLVNLSRTAEVPFIGKGSILPDASPDERALAAERLRAYFEKAPRQPTTLEVKALRELASRPSNVEQANVLIGSIYGELAVLRTKHSDELQQLIATHGAAVSSVLNPRDLSRGNSSRNLHDYKNLLAIWIASTLPTLGVSAEFEADVMAVARSITDQFFELDAPAATVGTDVIEIAEGLVQKFNHSANGRVVLDNRKASLKISKDAGWLSSVMDGLIQNALVHSTGQVTVRIDGNCIYVMNDAPQDIGFQIVRGEVYSGQLPTESTAEFGTATGLPWLLKTIGRESESSVRFDMWWHAGLVTAEVTLPYDSILENHEGQVTPLVLSPSRERITFICHDNVPDRSFTDVHSVPIQGAQYFSLKNAPRMFDYFPESAILEQFFDDNRKTFDDTFLCVVHTGVGGFQPFLSTMVERFPHMVIYAVTSDPNLFYRPETRSYDRSITASLDEHDLLARNSLTWQTVERFLRLEDRVTFAELNQWLHHRSPPTHIWQTLMRVAERMGTALTSGG